MDCLAGRVLCLVRGYLTGGRHAVEHPLLPLFGLLEMTVGIEAARRIRQARQERAFGQAEGAHLKAADVQWVAKRELESLVDGADEDEEDAEVLARVAAAREILASL